MNFEVGKRTDVEIDRKPRNRGRQFQHDTRYVQTALRFRGSPEGSREKAERVCFVLRVNKIRLEGGAEGEEANLELLSKSEDG